MLCSCKCAAEALYMHPSQVYPAGVLFCQEACPFEALWSAALPANRVSRF